MEQRQERLHILVEFLPGKVNYVAVDAALDIRS
jgi:hypothetical protein